MIIDFTIENFRSIKAEQILSLHVENPKTHLSEHVAYPAGDKVGVLKSAGIYGSNASGKSNVLLAFEALRYIACRSDDLKEGESFSCYEPYRLSEATKVAPVRFELEFFSTDNVRFTYLIAFTKDAILEEVLDFYPSRQKANLFKRGPEDTWETISFGGLYKGGAKRIPFFKNNSYLSKAGNNAAAAELIRSVYNYFRKTLKHIGSKEDVYSAEFFDDQKLMGVAAKFLCNVDTGISNVQSKINETKKLKFLEGFPEQFQKMVAERSKRQFFFAHSTDSGGVELFKQSLESEGTQKLFSILPLLLNAFENGTVMIIDELDNSFHPHIAELIIRLFNDSEINTKNAQLIFSTHNMHLMSSENLRRDQIWFVKKVNGASSLYSLDDFDKNKVKSDSPFETWYDEGRFGAVPKIDYNAIAGLFRPNSASKSVAITSIGLIPNVAKNKDNSRA
jgi:AAA15 family ATPase/GTPase